MDMIVVLIENIFWNLLWFFNVYVNFELNYNIFFLFIVFILLIGIVKKKNMLLNISIGGEICLILNLLNKFFILKYLFCMNLIDIIKDV